MDAATELSVAKHVRRVIALGVLLVVPACQIPNLHTPAPPPVLPESFNGLATPDNSAQLRIEDFFNDPVLVRLIYQGLAGNQELKILEQNIQLAQTEVMMRRGAIFPRFWLRGGAALDRSSAYTPEGAAERQLFAPDPREFHDLGTDAITEGSTNFSSRDVTILINNF